MLTDLSRWAAEVVSSFDGSDLFAFLAGVIFMIVWKNVRAMLINRDKTDRRHINLPKMNKKWFINGFIILAFLGIFWSTVEVNNAIKHQSVETRAIAERVCEDSKISSVERKALQDLFFALLNIPPQIANLDPKDPVRQQWGQDLGLKYLNTLDDAQQQRRTLQTGGHIEPEFWERYFAPGYTEPSCAGLMGN
jgi:hypothetical protein